jgi:hypothetical protein
LENTLVVVTSGNGTAILDGSRDLRGKASPYDLGSGLGRRPRPARGPAAGDRHRAGRSAVHRPGRRAFLGDGDPRLHRAHPTGLDGFAEVGEDVADRPWFADRKSAATPILAMSLARAIRERSCERVF